MSAESSTPPSFHPSSGKSERQRALLAQLEGKLFRASELAPRAADCPPQSAGDLIQGLKREKSAHGVFSRIVTRVSLDGETTAQGLLFPCGAEARALDAARIHSLSRDEEFAGIEPGQIAFIDTETTGLSGGTGTYPFLAGIGWFDGADFVVEQYFMEDYDEEEAMIEALRVRMAGFEMIASYNGKSFDVPLLRTRFVFHRHPSAWEKPHLDLLHFARRLWSARLPDCRLSTVERAILGVRRQSDVDSALVPRIYLDYVRGVRRSRIASVFDHHAQDIVSLGALLGRLGALMDNPGHPGHCHAGDQLGLARLFEQAGQLDRAQACFEQALSLLREPEMIYRVSLRLARHYRRRGLWREAAAVWETQVKSGPPGLIDAHIELAKYCEHHARDHRRAMELVEDAMRIMNIQNDWRGWVDSADDSESGTSLIEALAARMRRLEMKHSRSEEVE